ncbi:MAG: monovalent cation/H(+) antiporter subunit G [Candidatus Omnitrophica bacterium]|nr:monovalent cation/H(+) antiporter subunit G [Candidatus Omnitrophota bacterium]HOX54540.1 monovalent cation/H(+) antiporter subunit G [Candidatus Omnitrophota bacterium]
MIELAGYAFIILGLCFDLIGCIAIVRLPDVYSRLLAAIKSVVFGTTCMLLGTIIIKGLSATGVKAFLCMIFIIMTAPSAASALARGAHASGAKLSEEGVCDKYEDDKK